MNRMILALAASFVILILSAASVAAQELTIVTTLPRMRMTGSWRDGNGVHPGILRDGRHLSIAEFRAMPPVIIDGLNIVNATAIRRICTVSRRARTTIIDNVSVIARCPTNARLWQLIPGRMVALPPANAQPPPPTPASPSEADERLMEEERRRLQAEEENRRLQAEIDALQAQYDTQSGELARLQDQLREGVRRAAVNSEILRLNGELATANDNVRRLTTLVVNANRTNSGLTKRLERTARDRQRVEREHRQTVERLRRQDNVQPWPWWYYALVAIGAIALAGLVLLGVIVMIIDRRRLQRELEAAKRKPPKRSIATAIALTALEQRMREQDRDHREALKDLPGYNPDAPPEDNRVVLTNLKLLASMVTRGSGYQAGRSLVLNLEMMLASLKGLSDIVTRHAGYQPKKTLTGNLENMLTASTPPQIPAPTVHYYKDPDDENVLAEAEGKQRGMTFQIAELKAQIQRLQNALTIQGQEITRLTTDADLARDAAKELDASLKGENESHGRLDFQNESEPIENLFRRVAAILDSVRKERTLAQERVTTIEAQLFQTQTEGADNSALLGRLLELVLTEEPNLAKLGIKNKDLEAVISGLLDEIQLLRSETAFRVSNPASHAENNPLASPPPPEPGPDSDPSPDGVKTSVINATEHEALRATSAEPVHDSVPPTPMPSEGTKPKIKPPDSRGSRLPKPVRNTASGFPAPLAVQAPPADDASAEAATLRREPKATIKSMPPPPPRTNGGTNGKPYRMVGDEKPVTGKTMRPVGLALPITAPAMPPPTPPDAKAAARTRRRQQPPPEGSGAFVIDPSGVATPASQIPPPPAAVSNTGKIETIPPDAVHEIRDPNAPQKPPDLQRSMVLIGDAIGQGIGGMDSTRPPRPPEDTDDTDTIRARRPTIPPAPQ